jgi:hypothetical protein
VRLLKMLSVLPSRCEDIFLLLDSRLHPQGVRRGCTGLKPQQHTQRGNDETKMIGMSVPSRNI